jgi:hypothetical protein
MLTPSGNTRFRGVNLLHFDRVYPGNVAASERFNATVPYGCNGPRSANRLGLTFWQERFRVSCLNSRYFAFVEYCPCVGIGPRSIVPSGHDQNVYLVVNNYGNLSPAFAETDVSEANLETVITELSYRRILVTAGPVRRRRLWADGQRV